MTLSNKTLADQIEDLLPQTQCTKCGYASCRAYAEAIANGVAEINQCPPGGAEGIARLAHLLGKSPLPLNPENGVERPLYVAVIDELRCIACTLCIQACPVDAIVGAARKTHTVLPEFCTGCDLCLPPCPVDCIEMVNVSGDKTGWQAWSQKQADVARERYDQHAARLKEKKEAREARLAARAKRMRDASEQADVTDQNPKKALVQAAMARARKKAQEREKP